MSKIPNFKPGDFVNYDDENPSAIALVTEVKNVDYVIFDYAAKSKNTVEIYGFDAIATLCQDMQPNYEPEDVAFKKPQKNSEIKNLSFFSSWQPVNTAPVGEQIIIATECGRVREGILMPSGDALVAGSILKPTAWMGMPEHPEVMIRELTG